MRSRICTTAASAAIIMVTLLVIFVPETMAANTSIANMFKNLKNKFVKKVNQLTLSETSDCEVSQTLSLKMEQHDLPSQVLDVTKAATSKVESEEDGVSVLKTYWKDGEDVLKYKTVGTYDIKVIVKQADTKEKKCIIVPFEVVDTDECTLPDDHEWHHKCSSTATCINTRESYECMCPLVTIGGQDRNTLLLKQLKDWQKAETKFYKESTDDEVDVDSKLSEQWASIVGSAKSRFYWELNLPVEYIVTADETAPCKGTEASTKECCAGLDPHSSEGQSCRSNFVCPVDPCASTKAPTSTSLNISSNVIMFYECVPEASCERLGRPWDKPFNYRCACPEGAVGNGRPCGSAAASEEEGEGDYAKCGCTPVEPEPSEKEEEESTPARTEDDSTGDEL